jgi:SAM-dependent methyltransferase
VEPKPAGWAAGYARWFELASVADRYHLWPPYPAASFDVLASLSDPDVRSALDAGCGPGDLARPLARVMERVDAVDRSAARASGRFEHHGSLTTAPEPWRPTPDDLIGCHHSLRVDGVGRYRLTVQATVAWGRPVCGGRC